MRLGKLAEGDRRVTDISIVIPTYNRAHLVLGAIESCLSQDMDGLEIIVVDDGSTDDTVAVLAPFADRLRLVSTPNQGQCAARNLGAGMARGTWLKFLDSDDRLADGTLERELAAAKALGEMTIPVGLAALRQASGEMEPAPAYNHYASGAAIPLDRLLGRSLAIWLPLFPAAGYAEAGGLDTSLIISEDYDLCLRLYWHGYRFHCHGEVVVEVQPHAGPRISKAGGRDVFAPLVDMYRRQLDALTANGRDDAGHRTALGQNIWSMARTAARRGHLASADRLFALARQIAGRSAERGSRLIRLLYRLGTPARIERIMDRSKALLSFRTT